MTAEIEGAATASLPELRRPDAPLSEALHAARMGTWEWDVASGRVTWSPPLEEIHGLPAGGFPGTLEAYQGQIHPEDRGRVAASMEALVADTGSSQHELLYRIVRPDGEVRWLEAHGKAERDASGALIRVVGVCMDVTERTRLERERELAHERSTRLVAITTAIAAAVTEDEVFAAVVDQVGGVLGASSAGLWLVRNDRTAFLARSFGYADGIKAAMSGLSIDEAGQLPILDALRSGAPLVLGSREAMLEAYPKVGALVSPDRRYRVSCVPMRSRGEVIGGLGLTFDEVAQADDEQNFLALVAGYCAQALERLRLLEAERESRKRAEAAAERMALLSRASRAFSEVDSDLEATLGTIVEEVDAELAEACGITLVPDQGDELEVAAAGHRDPEGAAVMRALLASSAPRLGEGITGRVAATGEPVLLPRVDAARFEGPEYARYRGFIRRWMPGSIVAVPLRVHGRILGTLTAMRGRDAPPFDADDLALLTELGGRAAFAIERSRLQAASKESRERTELMYRLAARLIDAEDAEALCETALDGLQTALRSNRSSILAYDESGVMRFRAWRGLSQTYRHAVEGHSPWSRGVRDPQPIVVPDVLEDEDLAPYRPVFAAESIRGVSFIPLVADGELVGKFMVYYAEPRSIAPPEMETAQAIANHVAAAFSRFAAIEELQRAVRFNEMFTAMLGHDLRNPLGAIVNAAQLVLLREQSPRIGRPLGRILSASGRMARMIDQLLDFTRIRVGGGIPLHVAPLHLGELLDQAIDELSAAHPEWVVRRENVGDLHGQWDRDRLAQVFSNVLGNACQHGMVEHGCDVRIDGTSTEHVRVEVRNRGAIPTDVLPHIFEPMTGSNRRREGSRGLGLGMFITQRILDAHGGHIEARADETDGTTFTILLPRARAQASGKGSF